MSNKEDQPPTQEDQVPDLERASSSARASSGPVYSEEDASASVVANNSFVPAVVISEKEDPNHDGNGLPLVAAHQVDDGGEPQPQAPQRQQDSYRPSATASEHTASNNSQNFASNTAPEEHSANAKLMVLQDTRKGTVVDRLENGHPDPPPPTNPRRKNRKGLMLGICICLLAVIGIIVALVVALTGKEEDSSRDASLLTNRLTEAPSPAKLTTVPTTSPTVSTPVPSLTPTSSPSNAPTVNQNFCLQGTDTCGDVPGVDIPFIISVSLGADWQSLTCRADTSPNGNLRCTIVACNEVFPIATPYRILHLVSENTIQTIEFDEDAFELFENDNLQYLGFPIIKSETEVDIELPSSYFPNLEDLQVYLVSSAVWPFDPVDRLPNQIMLSFEAC